MTVNHAANLSLEDPKISILSKTIKPIPILMVTILFVIIVRISSIMGFEWVQYSVAQEDKKSSAAEQDNSNEPKTVILNTPKERELIKKTEEIVDGAVSKNAIDGEINISDLVKDINKFNPLNMKPQEIALLYKLAKRRVEVEKKDQALDAKRITLKALGRTLDQKIATLSALKKDIEDALNKAQTLQKQNVDTLVKMYEAMKPKDAARIFDGLNPQIVFLVMEKMNQSKSSLIIAKMDSEKARLITQKLATEREVDRNLAMASQKKG